MKPFDYAAPHTLSEALRLLAGEGARPLAGGTDLLVQMKYRRLFPSLLVDLKGVPELNQLERDGGGLHIGAAVPLAAIAAHPLVRGEYPALAGACALIGSVQIRNRATLGGNLCNAAPSADGAPPLLCYGARGVIAGPRGRRREMPMEDFFLGPGQTALRRGELLAEVVLPPPAPRTAASYLRFTPRQEMDIAVAGAGALLTLRGDGRCLQARIALAAVGPTPLRARQAEALLEGKTPSEESLRQASLKAMEEARPISDVRGSAPYRRELVGVLTYRTLRSCLNEVTM